MSRATEPAPLDFKRRVAAVAARWLIRMFGWTYRVSVVEGADVLERVFAGDKPVIFCAWHDGIFVWPPLFRQWQDRGVPLTIFTSLSRDGELVARLALAWGADVVRGSSSRGGREALRLLLRATKRDGRSPVIIPDGPRGPRRQAKPGAVVLARMTGRPCLLLGCAAKRGWHLPTWDRLLVPRPFTRVAVVVGEPLVVPSDAAEDQEELRTRLEKTLDALNDRAADAVR